jgi:hypothetical protein
MHLFRAKKYEDRSRFPCGAGPNHRKSFRVGFVTETCAMRTEINGIFGFRELLLSATQFNE